MQLGSLWPLLCEQHCIHLLHQEVWRIQAVCARIQLLEFQMPKLVFIQMSDTWWVWKQAMGWITELCGPVSPAIRGTAPCSLHAQVIQVQSQHPHSCSERNKEWSWLKDKTGANSTHRLKICLWGIQFNQFGKQTKWHDLQRLQGGTSKIYQPQNKWKRGAQLLSWLYSRLTNEKSLMLK